MKMRRCEVEKMRYRSPLLEEPCAQTLSGIKGPENPTCQLLPISSKKKGEDGMGKAGKGKEMVEDKSSERVLCEKVVREIFEKACASCMEVAEDRSCESCVGESCVCV